MDSIVTLISDYGAGSHYTATLKGCFAKQLPATRLIELSHEMEAFDITAAAFYLRQVYPYYPSGTWHFICLDTSLALHKQFLIVSYKDQYFIGADNGIFSLLFDALPSNVYKVLDSECSNADLFPEKNVFLKVFEKFTKQSNLKGFAEPGAIKTVLKSLQPAVDERGINGNVIMVDAYQNAITNISKEVFEKARAGRSFVLFYSRKQRIEKISTHYSDGYEGDDLVLFNENGFLEIAMNRGKGAQLLGLRAGSNIVIEFGD